MAVQIKSLKCPECGAQLDKEASFCPYCGAKVVLNDDAEHIYHIYDYARMREAEVARMRQAEEKPKTSGANGFLLWGLGVPGLLALAVSTEGDSSAILFCACIILYTVGIIHYRKRIQ